MVSRLPATVSDARIRAVDIDVYGPATVQARLTHVTLSTITDIGNVAGSQVMASRVFSKSVIRLRESSLGVCLGTEANDLILGKYGVSRLCGLEWTGDFGYR